MRRLAVEPNSVEARKNLLRFRSVLIENNFLRGPAPGPRRTALLARSLQ